MKLLIVDDREMDLQLLRLQLLAAGHSVVEAADGVEALKVLEREPVDGVISDVLMPRMDGYRLCLEIRKIERFRELPVVLYTNSNISPADHRLGEAAGADAYITKQASSLAILEALESATRNPRSHDRHGAPDHDENVDLAQYSERLVKQLETRNLELDKALESAAEIEARLSGLVESAFDAVIATDTMRTIVLFNKAATHMFGCTRSIAIGRPLNDFIPERFRTVHDAHIEAFGRGPAQVRNLHPRQVLGLRADGSEFPIEASIAKVPVLDGTLYTVFIRDISERRQAEQALERSEAGLRHAQDLAQLAHVITGPDGGFLSWSDSFPRLIGVDVANPPCNQREWISVIHSEDRARFVEGLDEALRTGARSDVTYRIRRGDDWIDIRQVMEPLTDEQSADGRGQRCFNTLQDITGLVRSETRIRSLSRVYAVLSGINSLIIRTQDRDELFRNACRIAVDVGKFKRAWVGVIEEGRPGVRVVACHGGPAEFFEHLQARLDTIVSGGKSILSRATSGGQPVVSNDIENDPEVLERHNLVAAGSLSLAIFPLVVGGRTAGILSLHAGTTDFFDGEEMKLLDELANDVAFALDHLGKDERIRYLAHYDALTGLPNRTQFVEHLSQRIGEMNDANGILAVVVIDLERFRRINETLGRMSGDELLKMVATRLRNASPSASRLGVDLFVFKVVDAGSVADVARFVDEVVARCFGHPFELAGDDLRLGCRAGIAVFPTDGQDAETLLRNAEAAVHRARAAAEHRVFYAPEMNARAAEELSIESKLRRAIERQEFVLHYQPKVRFSDFRVCGVEALLRWQSPELGLVPPARFISVLEESGLIGAVGQWALGQALADRGRWIAAGFAPLCVAVNVSPLQLHEPDFARRIEEAVAGVGGAALELEITESVIMDDVVRNIAVLKQIRGLGVNIAIDDFGTGYSSLSYIARLPVNSLKIDRAFVIGMTESREGLAMVSSIVALARALQLKVVAEGVETEEQARLLRLISCDEAQGFLYSRPVPADGLQALLAAGGSLPVRPTPATGEA